MAYEQKQVECPHCGLLTDVNHKDCWHCNANLDTGIRRYGQWAGRSNGRPEDVALCVNEVMSQGRDMMQWHCTK